MKEDLLHDWALGISCLHFFSSNILALSKLENIFLPINDLHGTISWQNHPHISCFEPPVTCDCLVCLFGIFIVPHKDSRPSQPNLSPRGRPTLLVLVIAGIVHFWDVS